MRFITRTIMPRVFTFMKTTVGAFFLASGLISNLVQGQVCDPAPVGLVGWWQAEGNTGDVYGINNGTALGSLSYSPGEVGQAFNFDGFSAYVSIPASPSLDVGSGGGLTIEGWIKPVNVSSLGPLVEWNNGGGSLGPVFRINEPTAFGGGGPASLYANLIDVIGTGHVVATVSNVLSTTSFYHVAVTYDKSSGAGTIYLNGSQIVSQNLGIFTPQTTFGVILGSEPSSSAYFNGLMDEMSIYSRALSGTEILAIYNSGSAGKCIPAPTITTQPQGQTVSAGNGAQLVVSAMGPAPLKYQWQFNTSNILNATNSSLIFPSAQTTNTGNYLVIVSNAAGPTASSNAFLNVVLPSCVNASSNQVGWWQGEGDASDSTGLNAGTVQGNVTFVPGKVGQAFNFDGTNGLVRIPASSSLNVGTNAGFSLEGWIKPVNVSSLGPLVEWNSGSGGLGPVFRINEPTVLGGGGPGSLYANFIDVAGTGHVVTTAANLLSTTSFNHVAVTYDGVGGTGTIYLNGISVASQNLGVFTPRTTFGVILGSEPTSSYFGGLMDEMRIYNSALSSNQIQAIYNASYAGECGVAPSVLTQPQSQSVSPGANVTFTAGVSGSRPMSYQWKLNNSTVAGTNYSLTLTNVQPSQAGNYSLSVSNGLAPAFTSNAVLEVNVMTVRGNGQPLTNAQYAFGGSVTIQLQNFYTNGDIFYTLDGSTPTAGSTQYTAPFVVTNSVVIRALGYSTDFLQAGQSDPVTILILPLYPLVVTTAGGGSISPNPTNGTYVSSTVVTLKATPAAGWTFFQWLGDASGTNTNTTVTVTRNEFVQAVFGTTLNATVAPSGSGSVMFNPPGGLYPFGTTVLLSAVPQAGNYFALWGNAANGSGNTNPLPFALTSPDPTVSTLFATLGSNQVALTVVPVGRGKVSLNPAGTVFTTGQMVTLAATPNQGQTFVNWSGDATGAQNPLPVTLNQSKTIFANFSIGDQLSFRPLSMRSFSEGFELTLTGEFGMPYRIDGSTNLSNWVQLITLTNTLGTMQFIDYGTTNFPWRFYRGVPLP